MLVETRLTHINLHLYFHSIQARRQDSVIGGAEINFGEAQEVYLCEFERNTGAREIYSSVDQTKKVKTKKKGLRPKFYEIWCESTKITKIRAVNTNLGVSGLDLHPNGPEPVNFFGAQSSLGGAQFSFGGHSPGMPLRGAKPDSIILTLNIP